MKTATIGDARSFSLEGIQRNPLLATEEVEALLLCFEAGQREEESVHGGDSLYQVLEGEMLVETNAERERFGKGKLLAIPAGSPHVLENAGGGLLVVLLTRARDA